jgi:hypothetical protein
MKRSKLEYLEGFNTANTMSSYIVPGLGDFGDRFYTM